MKRYDATATQQPKNRSRLQRGLGIIALALNVAACSSHQPATVEGPLANAPTQRISVVAVKLAGEVAADARDSFTEMDGSARLRAATERKIASIGKLDPSSHRVLELEVDKYRVRSGATVFWLGIMAGVDYMDVVARVYDGETLVKEFATGAGTSGAFAGLTSSSRFDLLVQAVAERVAEKL